ncbi:hypothetical protein BH11MYX1_BH11MYX1_32380 [soil metagenome]
MSIPLSKRFSARMSSIGTLPKPAPIEATDVEVQVVKPARFSFKTSHHARLPELEKPNAYMAELEATEKLTEKLMPPTSRN